MILFKDPNEEWGVREFSLLIFAVFFHIWDVYTRLSGNTFEAINYPMILGYVALALLATLLLDKKDSGSYDNFFDKMLKVNSGTSMPRKFISYLFLSFIAYCIPLFNYFFVGIENYAGLPLRIIGGGIIMFAPVWVLYILYKEPKFLARVVGTSYAIGWVIVLIVSVVPIAQYELHNVDIPGILPGRTIGTIYEKFITGKEKIVEGFKIGPATLKKEFTDSMIYAKTGVDPQQAKVDESKQRNPGVEVLALKASSPKYFEGDQVAVYAQIRAETLEEPVQATVNCIATGVPEPGTIFPQSSFQIDGSDIWDIDCVFPKNELTAGTHKITLTTKFNFETVAYIETFFMEEEKIREMQKKRLDPLAGYPQPKATSSKGPVNINIRTPQAPIASRADKKATVGITIHNTGGGKIEKITNLFIFIPAGLSLATEIDSTGVFEEITCDALPPEEARLCNPAAAKVYRVAPGELSKDQYQDILSGREFRMYLNMEDYDTLIGDAPVKPGSFYASAKYNYELEKSLQIKIEEPVSI